MDQSADQEQGTERSETMVTPEDVNKPQHIQSSEEMQPVNGGKGDETTDEDIYCQCPPHLAGSDDTDSDTSMEVDSSNTQKEGTCTDKDKSTTENTLTKPQSESDNVSEAEGRLPTRSGNPRATRGRKPRNATKRKKSETQPAGGKGDASVGTKSKRLRSAAKKTTSGSESEASPVKDNVQIPEKAISLIDNVKLPEKFNCHVSLERISSQDKEKDDDKPPKVVSPSHVKAKSGKQTSIGAVKDSVPGSETEDTGTSVSECPKIENVSTKNDSVQDATESIADTKEKFVGTETESLPKVDAPSLESSIVPVVPSQSEELPDSKTAGLKKSDADESERLDKDLAPKSAREVSAESESSSTSLNEGEVSKEITKEKESDAIPSKSETEKQSPLVSESPRASKPDVDSVKESLVVTPKPSEEKASEETMETDDNSDTEKAIEEEPESISTSLNEEEMSKENIKEDTGKEINSVQTMDVESDQTQSVSESEKPSPFISENPQVSESGIKSVKDLVEVIAKPSEEKSMEETPKTTDTTDTEKVLEDNESAKSFTDSGSGSTISNSGIVEEVKMVQSVVDKSFEKENESEAVAEQGPGVAEGNPVAAISSTTEETSMEQKPEHEASPDELSKDSAESTCGHTEIEDETSQSCKKLEPDSSDSVNPNSNSDISSSTEENVISESEKQFVQPDELCNKTSNTEALTTKDQVPEQVGVAQGSAVVAHGSPSSHVSSSTPVANVKLEETKASEDQCTMVRESEPKESSDLPHGQSNLDKATEDQNAVSTVVPEVFTEEKPETLSNVLPDQSSDVQPALVECKDADDAVMEGNSDSDAASKEATIDVPVVQGSVEVTELASQSVTAVEIHKDKTYTSETSQGELQTTAVSQEGSKLEEGPTATSQESQVQPALQSLVTSNQEDMNKQKDSASETEAPASKVFDDDAMEVCDDTEDTTTEEKPSIVDKDKDNDSESSKLADSVKDTPSVTSVNTTEAGGQPITVRTKTLLATPSTKTNEQYQYSNTASTQSYSYGQQASWKASTSGNWTMPPGYPPSGPPPPFGSYSTPPPAVNSALQYSQQYSQWQQSYQYGQGTSQSQTGQYYNYGQYNPYGQYSQGQYAQAYSGYPQGYPPPQGYPQQSYYNWPSQAYNYNTSTQYSASTPYSASTQYSTSTQGYPATTGYPPKTSAQATTPTLQTAVLPVHTVPKPPAPSIPSVPAEAPKPVTKPVESIPLPPAPRAANTSQRNLVSVPLQKTQTMDLSSVPVPPEKPIVSSLSKESIAAQLLQKARAKQKSEQPPPPPPPAVENKTQGKEQKAEASAGRSMGPKVEAKHLCIGNLPQGTKATELRDTLAIFGKVVSCKVAAAKGANAAIFAFVSIECLTDANTLTSSINGWEFNGAILSCKKLKNPPGGKPK